MAPITPFLTDYVWDVLRAEDGPDSVHLATWPVADEPLIDDRARPRRWRWPGGWWSSAGRRGPRALVKVRQPLPRAVIARAGFRGAAR